MKRERAREGEEVGRVKGRAKNPAGQSAREEDPRSDHSSSAGRRTKNEERLEKKIKLANNIKK